MFQISLITNESAALGNQLIFSLQIYRFFDSFIDFLLSFSLALYLAYRARPRNTGATL